MAKNEYGKDERQISAHFMGRPGIDYGEYLKVLHLGKGQSGTISDWIWKPPGLVLM